MKIKRFFAKDMRSALSEVKEELGPDAVIMSNKKVSGGVEIVAAVDPEPHPSNIKNNHVARDELEQGLGQARRKLADDKVNVSPLVSKQFASVLQNYAATTNVPDEMASVDSLTALLQRQSKHQNQQQSQPNHTNDGDRGQARQHDYHNDNHDQQRQQLTAERQSLSSPSKPARRYDDHPQDLNIGDYTRPSSKHYEREASVGRKPRLDPSRYEAKGTRKDDELEGMRAEIISIRRLLEHQLSGLMWQEVERQEPMRAMMIKRLKTMGLSDQLADQFACYISEDLPINEAWPALLDLLADQLITTDDCILEVGGVVALLGPTGVGKTTTIAKLAARAAMEFGPHQIALVTTDNYRIGAHEQLATYGRIMGCPVRVAKDAQELADILHQLRHRRLVLLDTAGMGQRDIRLSEQLDTLMQNSGAKIRSYLVMPATSQRRVLQETLEHFRRIPLSGCVLTKLDESLSLGEIIGVAIQNALPIAYLADGQRVPEDLKVATGNYLVSRANELLELELSQQSHVWSSDSPDNNAADFYD
ncbi:flagellar biosynthesis protein FlhF [Photobacterium carnosum]|uniref:Flagellar biosynthesis protein FlhF n=1 Tax=Photobacterium carnosum TaxID=2023717 RepID=A0A2N4UXS1_9GAMM|nr:flagellar biosynthesis protein FlhF [Photobacterium carnosum]MBY3787251.1 flagellar biosynthesis protein FlhF [Photobacterium carnosum]MCD9532542.1 flagellar biosynthesis protein FlhF [Photobacterium carnosum]MCD9536535.1 flagellar biosynthesis protein FlhF [Photobacterium carnosum]MCF2161096.1 flagellar biosynthesis protein FlhF [Photobacterium carnosum]PLC59820.1 flagellar biosynthesis protein FlhF [Photobacterium carnosum]